MNEDLIYSDEKGIRITSKRFYIGDKSYPLNRIKKIDLGRLTPRKMVGVGLFIIGVSTILLGSFEMLGYANWSVGDEIWLINFDFASIALGVIAISAAIVRMMYSADEYSIKIKIEKADDETIISDNRQYAARLVASLKRAYYRQKSANEKFRSKDLIIA